MAKAVKICAIVVAIIAAIVGIYICVTKFINKKQAKTEDEDNYVSCSCGETDDFKTETVA
ncbi:MAG: hypothetical protein K6C36_09195 [Clostridia bacterium]|nr:hypothetical protein [Clostridia bacterium]